MEPRFTCVSSQLGESWDFQCPFCIQGAFWAGLPVILPRSVESSVSFALLMDYHRLKRSTPEGFHFLAMSCGHGTHILIYVVMKLIPVNSLDMIV